MSSLFPLLAVCVLLCPGCYSYRVASLQDVQPGAAVRVRITPQEAERLVELRMTEDRLVQGILLENGGEGLMLDTRVGVNDPQRGSRAFLQRISIPLTEVREVELRQLDALKTGAAIGALGIGVGIVAAAALGGGSDGDDPGGGGEPELRRPWRFGFRLPIGTRF